MEQMVALQQQATQREERTAALFQSMLEQQRRQSEMIAEQQRQTAFHFGFIYQQLGIQAPSVLPAPHVPLQSLPRTPTSQP